MSEPKQRYALNTITNRIIAITQASVAMLREKHIVECDEKGNKIGIETDDANLIHSENLKLQGLLDEQTERNKELELENAKLRSTVTELEQRLDPDYQRREALNVKTREELLTLAKEIGIANPGTVYRKGDENGLVQAIIDAEKAAADKSPSGDK